jgi:hypothetical protein
MLFSDTKPVLLAAVPHSLGTMMIEEFQAIIMTLLDHHHIMNMMNLVTKRRKTKTNGSTMVKNLVLKLIQTHKHKSVRKLIIGTGPLH